MNSVNDWVEWFGWILDKQVAADLRHSREEFADAHTDLFVRGTIDWRIMRKWLNR